MNRGLLAQGILESGLASNVRELSLDASMICRQKLEDAFAVDKAKSTLAWERFGAPARTWSDVENSLDEVIHSIGVVSERIWLLEEEWRDPIVFDVPAILLPRIISEAWYPSDDIYVYAHDTTWCLAFTHHDTISLFRRKAG